MVTRASAAGQGIRPGLQTARQSVAENTALGQSCPPRQCLLTHEPASLLIAAIRRHSSLARPRARFDIEQVIGAEVRELRLTPAQFWVLGRAVEHEATLRRDLAASLYMDTPTASRVRAL